MTHRLPWAVLLLAGGCAVGSYSLVLPGVNSLGRLQVMADGGWNQAPAGATPSARPVSQTWTRDGLLLDRVVIIPGVGDGEPLFESRDKTAALPVFRKDMLPNELEELTESSVVKLFGEGNAAVTTEKLRPWGFGGDRGVLFDIRAAVTESPDYRGMVGAFVADDHLYLILFLAAEPHYYDKHRARAEELIKSATLMHPAVPPAG